MTTAFAYRVGGYYKLRGHEVRCVRRFVHTMGVVYRFCYANGQVFDINPGDAESMRPKPLESTK